jgi:hypothetical protein
VSLIGIINSASRAGFGRRISNIAALAASFRREARAGAREPPGSA